MATSVCAPADAEIPRVVHQSWRSRELPSTLRPMSESWSRLPGWRHRLWTDDENRALWAQHFPELLDVYDGYTRPVQRADATRLLYMHLFGGVYADLDVAPCHGMQAAVLPPATAAAQRPQLLLLREPSKGPKDAHKRYLTNFWLASAPGHPFWRHAIGQLRGRGQHRDVMSATGPYFLNAAWNTYREALEGAAAQAQAQAQPGGGGGGSGAAACAAQTRARISVLTFAEWQRGVAAHHWASTWHYGNATSDPLFQEWLGVDRSANCAEGAFTRVISSEWDCRKHRYRCPRRTWAVFEAECNLTKHGCPEALRRRQQREGEWRRREEKRAARATSGAAASAAAGGGGGRGKGHRGRGRGRGLLRDG